MPVSAGIKESFLFGMYKNTALLEKPAFAAH